MRLHNKIWASR